MITGTSAVVPDWCYLIPYCSELRNIDVTSQDGDPSLNLPLPISTNTTDCFFLTNVSKRFRDIYDSNFLEYQVPSLFRREDTVCAQHSNTSRSQPT